jgi:glycosyltransferase involved in cell wall biosynthesis
MTLINKKMRVAWLLPSMGTGGISFQHLLCEFTKQFPNTKTFTGQWCGYAAGFENTYQVEVVGETKHVDVIKTANGYNAGFSLASPDIIRRLLQFKPDIIFANAFSMWTAIALFLKPIGHWKVVIIYEGGSPTYESDRRSVRLVVRRLLVKLADAFVVNSQTGRSYFLNVLNVNPTCLIYKPFLVPSVNALLHYSEAEKPQIDDALHRPIFLFVGQVVPRKGLQILLEACTQLQAKGISNYTLMIVGDGEQRAELEDYTRRHQLTAQVRWIGRVEYRCLGAYFQLADVFVFPTHEDIWGMVLTEAMAFGKAVICSKEAGAAEMVIEEENGFIYDPTQSTQLVELMQRFIEQLGLISKMGKRSRQIMSNHTPAHATQAFVDAATLVDHRAVGRGTERSDKGLETQLEQSTEPFGRTDKL